MSTDARDTSDTIDGEVLSRQMSAAEQLPMGMQLLRMENEQIMSLARVAPRDPAIIVSQLKAFLQAYPAAALEAIYAKPVGSVYSITCKDCNIVYEADGSGPGVECTVCGSKAKTNIERRQKYAEGLSIRAAETIRSVYGFTRLAVRMSLDESGKATIEGTLVDYAAGNMTSDERVVTPFYKSRDGDIRRTPEDRFLGVVVKAEKSKLRRDLILDSVPAIIKAVYRDECEAVIDSVVPEDFVNQKILPAFQRFGISKAHLEQIIGAKVATGWTKEQSRELSQLLNGLKSGDTTVQEILAPLSVVEPGSANDPTKAARGDTLAEINAKRRAAKQSAAENAESRRVDGHNEPAIEKPETASAEAKTPENPAESSGDQAALFNKVTERIFAAQSADDLQSEETGIAHLVSVGQLSASLGANLYGMIKHRLANLPATEAPSTPQDGPRLHTEPEAEQADVGDQGELPEPYTAEERQPVIEKLLASIDSAMTKKRLDAIAAQIHGDERLSDTDLNDLVDKIDVVRAERNLN